MIENDPALINKVSRVVSRLCSQYGCSENRLDIIQEVLIEYRPTTSVENNFFDALRRYFGDARSSLHTYRQAERHHSELHDSIEIESGTVETSRTDFNQLLIGARPEDRIFLILYYEYGFTLKELGYLWNLSESRMSQRCKAILQRMEKTISTELSSQTQGIRKYSEQSLLSCKQIGSSVFNHKTDELEAMEACQSNVFYRDTQTQKDRSRESSLLCEIKQDAWLLPEMVF